MSDGSLSPSSKDSAIDLYESDRRLSEEIDYLVSQRAAEIVKKSYERDRVEFQQICNTFSTVNCMENVQHVFNHKIDELKTVWNHLNVNYSFLPLKCLL